MYEIAIYSIEQVTERENQIVIGKRHLVPDIECYLTLWQTDTFNKEELDDDPNIIRYIILTKGEINANS